MCFCRPGKAKASGSSGREARCSPTSWATKAGTISSRRWLSSWPTRGALDVLNSAKLTGRVLSIVSNNSREAVTTYLNTHDLTQYFDRIVGRYEDVNPALLKPSAHLVDLATAGLGTAPDASALVGDSVTDVGAASAARIPSIGYANKDGKTRALKAAGASTVIGSMVDLADALREAPFDPAGRAE